MVPATARLTGNILLGLGIIVLLVALAGMSGLTGKLAPSREMVFLAAVLVLGGQAFRRRGRLPAP